MIPTRTINKDRAVRALAGFFIMFLLLLEKIFLVDLSIGIFVYIEEESYFYFYCFILALAMVEEASATMATD